MLSVKMSLAVVMMMFLVAIIFKVFIKPTVMV